MADIEAPRYVPDGFSVLPAPKRFPPLIGSQLRLASQLDTTHHGTGSALAHPGANELPLEFCQAAKHRQDKASGRDGGISPRVSKRPETGLFSQ
jgi:hypothetical protein